jgi:DNA mismatch endonuclease, patch repair protein
MSDVFSRAKRSEVMSRIRSRGNKGTELAAITLFRKLKITGWRRGQRLRYDVIGSSCLVRPDFVFRKQRIAVFIDGEFWHGHPTRARIPKTRTAWWRKKIEGNRARDKRQNRLLRKHGWTVIRIWQFELKTAAALRKLDLADLMHRV